MGKTLVKIFLGLFSWLPLKVHYFNARIIYVLVRYVARYRMREVTINLARCFPHMQYCEFKGAINGFYRHFSELVVEAIWFGGCRNPRRLKKADIMKIANPEVLNDAFEKAPSVMVLYSHTGNWELLGGIENYSDVPTCMNEQNFCVVYREMSSKAWDAAMKDNRFAPVKDKKHFEGYIESKNIMRYAVAHRREKKVYNMNTDQRPYFNSPEKHYVNFMGQKVETMQGGAALACKLGMAVLYLGQERTRRGHYDLRYTLITEDAKTTTPEDIMKRYYELLEADIHKDPTNYLWTHRRWVE